MLTGRILSTNFDGMSAGQYREDELVALARGADPEAGLAAITRLRHIIDEAEAVQVERARGQGWSWEDIGRVLGVSRQAAHHKHGGVRLGRKTRGRAG